MREGIAGLLRHQADWCARLGSPLYDHLLRRAAEDVEAGGVVLDVLVPHADDPSGSALALRLMGSVHRLVLAGDAPDLAAHYPSAGGDATSEDAWPAFRETVETNLDALRELVRRPVQTNEVGRSAAMLGGFLVVAERTGLPLRLLELGASAGLNLRWDRFRYESAGWSWGNPDSPVRFTDVFEDDGRPVHASTTVVERAGCDTRPIDPTTEDGRLTLLAYTWADQMQRIARLRGALEIAARVPARLDEAPAPRWTREQLEEPHPGAATVVSHSVVMQYLTAEGRGEVARALEEAGARATPDAPLAWLRMEPSDPSRMTGHFEVRLTMWPGGEDHVLAIPQAHGPPVRWLNG